MELPDFRVEANYIFANRGMDEDTFREEIITALQQAYIAGYTHAMQGAVMPVRERE